MHVTLYKHGHTLSKQNIAQVVYTSLFQEELMMHKNNHIHEVDPEFTHVQWIHTVQVTKLKIPLRLSEPHLV